MSCHRKKFLVTGRNTQITPILNIFYRVWLPLVRAKFLAESIGSHEVKYFIPPCSRQRSFRTPKDWSKGIFKVSLFLTGYYLSLHTEDFETTTDYAEIVLDNVEVVPRFSICFWMKLKFLSASFNQVWQYCHQPAPDQSMSCTAFGRKIVANSNTNNDCKTFKASSKVSELMAEAWTSS